MSSIQNSEFLSRALRGGRQLLRNQFSGLILAILLIGTIAQLGNPTFLSPYNVRIIIRALAFVGLVALGQSLVLIIGELDLSVGAVAGLSAVLGGILMVNLGINPVLAFILALGFGALFGVINGTIISSLNLSALVVTIGMQGVYKGINLVMTKGAAITNIPEEILFLGQGVVGNIPVPFIVLLIMAVVVAFITQGTKFGRYMYAIGNSREAARIVGIRVNLIRILTFMMTAFMAALAGMLMVSRMGSSQPAIGEAWLLTSVAASVIGGVSLTGGIGHPAGAILGAALIGIIENIIVIFGISPYWQTAVSGIVVVLAISIDSISRGTWKMK
jgi:ribose transport system permease protein